jgi:hypothetical protein
MILSVSIEKFWCRLQSKRMHAGSKSQSPVHIFIILFSLRMDARREPSTIFGKRMFKFQHRTVRLEAHEKVEGKRNK